MITTVELIKKVLELDFNRSASFLQGALNGISTKEIDEIITLKVSEEERQFVLKYCTCFDLPYDDGMVSVYWMGGPTLFKLI